MRRFFLLLATVGLLALPLQAQQARKKVAVVLSGGGAKGMAHIGALKVIERAGIPVDIVTGTSMGSIIGGLYSIGYNANLLDSLVREQDWTFLLSDKTDVSKQSLNDRRKQNTYLLSKDITLRRHVSPGGGGFIVGKNLANLFARLTVGYRDSMDFNRLPIPFACVATNIVDNTEYDFHSGVLAEAMRTSMSIPGVFAPVRKGDMMLVDGGLRNNYPVDIARAMGADVVIGVTVQGPPKTADDLKTAATVLGQIVDVNCKNKYEDNMRQTDVLIQANTTGYSAASFTRVAIDTLIRRGEEEALKHWDELLALKKELGLPAGYRPAALQPATANELPARMRLNRITFTDVDKGDEAFLRFKFRLANRDSVSVKDIEHIIASMRVDLYYDDADYDIRSRGGSYDVDITARGKKTSQVNLGVRFDTEEMVALQTNAGFHIKAAIPINIEGTLRLGKRIMGRADFSLTPVAFSRLTLSYIYRHDDMNVYNGGDRVYNNIYNEHKVHLNVVDFNIRNFNFHIGARFDYFNFNDVLIDPNVQDTFVSDRDVHFISYHANVEYNSEDKWNFPTRGANFQAGFGYYTDDLANYGSHLGFSIVNAMWRMSYALTRRTTLQPMLYGRLLFGGGIPNVKHNVIGGNWFDHYVEGQMPFAGVGHIEQTDDQFVALQLKLQERITDNNYIIAKVAAAQHADKLRNILDHGPMMGYQIGYYYNSIFGPLGATLGYSSKTKEPYFYINLGFEF